MSVLNKIKQRGGVSGLLLPLAGNRLALYLFRFSHFLSTYKIPEIPYLLQYVNAVVNGCEIHFRAQIGENFKISHSRGVVIGAGVHIGDNVTIHSGVVFGKKDENSGMPTVGNNIFIGAGAVLLGDIVIGDNCIIGANAVVNKSFGANSIIGGVPAKKINVNA